MMRRMAKLPALPSLGRISGLLVVASCLVCADAFLSPAPLSHLPARLWMTSPRMGRGMGLRVGMQLADDSVEKIKRSVQEVVGSGPGISQQDRAAELFSGSVAARPWESLFRGMGGSAEFRKDAWGKQPFIFNVDERYKLAEGCFTMDHVSKHVGDYPTAYVAQGALSPDGKGGWYMRRVGDAGQPSAGDVPMTKFSDVEDALQRGTVVLNSAGAYISPLAAISLATLDASLLPVGLNLYITNPAMQLSAPPHTDKQDVFVVQAQGCKRWRVFAPPEPSGRIGSDPYARGKGPDECKVEELGEPLIDTVLKAGELLYVPAGFPHTTDTNAQETQREASVHLTIGLDTHIWGLTYAFLRQAALQRAGEKASFRVGGTDRDATALGAASYFGLNAPLPLGFMAPEAMGEEEGRGPEARRTRLETLTRHVARECVVKMKEAEPDRWEGEAAEALVERLNLEEVTGHVLLHYKKVLAIQRRMYLDGSIGISAAPNSLLRVQHYMTLLDKAAPELDTTAPAMVLGGGLGGGGGIGGGGQMGGVGAGKGMGGGAGAKGKKAKAGKKKR